MQEILAEVAAGVLTNVISATGRWIAGSAVSTFSRGAGRDGDIAAWFDTYELVGTAFPDMDVTDAETVAWVGEDRAPRWHVPDAMIAPWLGDDNDVHGVLHELLAARLTDAPETDVEQLRGALRELARTEFGGRTVRRGISYVLLDTDMAYGIADLIFDWADGQICELVGTFQARDPERWRQARADAFGSRIVAVLGATHRHIAALAGRPDPEVDAEWVERYLRQARQAYGSIEPPDFARRREVPIGALYVPPDIVEPGAARDADGNPATIGFDDLASRVDRTVLLGDPGGGKSTASRVLAYRWAGTPSAHAAPGDRCTRPGCGGTFAGGFCEQCGAAQIDSVGDASGDSGHSRVPFLVVLRDFAGDDGPRGSVVEHIEERLNTFHQCAAPDGAVERLLLSGSAAVIFDGLDELIDTGRRVEITRIVEQFCTRFPLAPVLVTSRLVGYDEARLDDTQFEVYRIAGFTRDETAAYVRNWFALEDDTDADTVAGAFMRESEQVVDLRANPLMLALMCILYRGEGTLPRNRPGVYAECARMLFDKWDTRRGIHVDLQARNLIEPALRHVAYWLFTRDGSPEVTEAGLVARVADLLHERGFEQWHDAEAAALEFVRFCRGRAWILGDAGTTSRGESLYTFTHRTFLEYFAAAHLASVTDTPEELALAMAPRVAEGQWDVVGQLAVQIKDAATDRGAERVLRALLDELDDASDDAAQTNLVAFSARCLDVAEVPPTLIREITNRAFDQLEPDAPHAISYLPLRHERVRPPAAEVIFQRVAALVGSQSRADRTLGLRFAAYATFLGAYSTTMGNWHRLEQHLTVRHRDSLIAAAKTDDVIWMRLVDRGVITLAEALRLRGNDLTVLLRTIPVPMVVNEVRAWPPFVNQALSEINRNGQELAPDPDAAVDRIRAFADVLPNLPPPPWWVAEPVREHVHRPMIHIPVGRLTAAEAAAAVVLIALDIENRPWDPSAHRQRGLDVFDSLIERAGDEPAWLADHMERWQRSQADFVQWRHDEPE